MPLDAESWAKFSKNVCTLKGKPKLLGNVFFWRLAMERIAVPSEEADREEEETRLLIAVFRFDAKLVEVRIHFHGTKPIRGEHRLYLESMGTVLPVDKDLVALADACQSILPPQTQLQAQGGLKFWKQGLDSFKTGFRRNAKEYEPALFVSEIASQSKLDEVWQAFTDLQERLIKLMDDVDKAKDAIYNAKKDDVLGDYMAPVSDHKATFDDVLRKARLLFQGNQEAFGGFIHTTLLTRLSIHLGDLAKGKQEKFNQLGTGAEDRFKRGQLEDDHKQLDEVLGALQRLESPEGRSYGAILKKLTRDVLEYVSAVPITAFKFRGFNNVSLGAIDFSLTLQENMVQYLRAQGLDELADGTKPVNPLSVQYIVSAGRQSFLRRSKLAPSVFDITYDWDTTPLSDRAQALVQIAIGAGASIEGFTKSLKPTLTEALTAVCESTLAYLNAIFLCACEVVPRLNKLRVRVLSAGGRRNFLTQRLIQSGDSNGMAVALMMFPELHYHLIIGPKDVGRAKSLIDFYQRFGLQKDRVLISIVYSDRTAFAWKQHEQDLAQHCGELRLIRMIGAKDTDKEDQFYQLVSNSSVAASDVQLLYMNILYDFDNNVHQPVGESTGKLKRAIQKNVDRQVQLHRTVYWALDQGLQVSEREDVQQFVQDFMKSLVAHYDLKTTRFEETKKPWHPQKYINPSQAREQGKDVFVLLVWIRGPQGEEGLAENLATHEKSGLLTPKKGKPWHHATQQLWVTLRHMAYQLTDELGTTVCLVPVGDPLKSDNYDGVKQTNENWHRLILADKKEKNEKPHNLIKFFERVESFKNRNRFTQMYLFYELFKQRGFCFAQVGLRSGAIEQGMYLGIPTIYIDINQKSVTAFRPGEEDTTARMLGMTAAKNGFPMFHCQFSMNAIGGHPGFVDAEQRQQLGSLVRGETLQEQPEVWLKGTLTPLEALEMKAQLTQIYEQYQDHYGLLRPDQPPNAKPS